MGGGENCDNNTGFLPSTTREAKQDNTRVAKVAEVAKTVKDTKNDLDFLKKNEKTIKTKNIQNYIDYVEKINGNIPTPVTANMITNAITSSPGLPKIISVPLITAILQYETKLGIRCIEGRFGRFFEELEQNSINEISKIINNFRKNNPTKTLIIDTIKRIENLIPTYKKDIFRRIFPTTQNNDIIGINKKIIDIDNHLSKKNNDRFSFYNVANIQNKKPKNWEEGVKDLVTYLRRRHDEFKKVYTDSEPTVIQLLSNQGPDGKGFLSNQDCYKKINPNAMGAYCANEKKGEKVGNMKYNSQVVDYINKIKSFEKNIT